MCKGEDASYPSFCLGRDMAFVPGAHGLWTTLAHVWMAQRAQCLSPARRWSPLQHACTCRAVCGVLGGEAAERWLRGSSSWKDERAGAVVGGVCSPPSSPAPQTSEPACCERCGVTGWPVGLWCGPVCEGGRPCSLGNRRSFPECEWGRSLSQGPCHLCLLPCFQTVVFWAISNRRGGRDHGMAKPGFRVTETLLWWPHLAPFLFLFLCCGVSKQVPDITAFHLSALSYMVQKNKNQKPPTPALLRQ